MKNRLALLANALAAAAALAGLVVGVPWALVTFVGSPLPTAVPTAADVVTALRHQGVDPAIVVKILAVVVWLAWAQIAWATLVEIRAAAAGRLAARQPVLPAVQVGVARLVAAVTIAAASLTAPKLPAAAATQPALAAVVAGPATTVIATGDTIPSAAGEVEAGPLPQWTVARHDTYWDIAERTLGDGHAWRRIRDLNAGRTMPDGTVITATSDLLRPGWTLHLPAEAHAPAPEPDPDGQAVEEPIGVVEAGEHLWALAERELAANLGREPTTVEVTHYWGELLDLNRHHLADPDVVQAGQTVALPDRPSGPPPMPPATPNAPIVTAADPQLAEPTAAPAAAPAPAPTSVPTTALPTVASSEGAVDDAAPDAERPAAPGVLGVAGGTLAVGVALGYRRRRTRVASRLPRGRDLPAPTGFDDLRAELATSADLDDVARRDAALADVARTGAAIAEARTGDRSITVRVHQPAPPPLGWTADSAATTWTLDGSSAPLSAGAWSPAPLLVTVGRVDDTEVHVDLESLGVVAVVGEADEVAGFVRAVAAEVAHAPSSRRAHLVTVGATGDLVAGDAPHRAFTWDDVADDLVALARQTATAVEAANSASPLAARAGRDAPDDALVPTLVVVSSVPDDPRFAELSAIVAEGRSAVAVLVAGPAAPATVITVADGNLAIPSLDVHAAAQVLAADTVDAIEDLLAAAEDVPAEPPKLDFGDDAAVPAGTDPDVVVRVLGAVRVDGAFRHLTPKQTAVVTYIALHAPVTAERIEVGVWPDATGSRRKRLANVLSECRNALGANALPVADGGLYRLGPGVTTDTALFDAHVRAAREHHPDSPDARIHLRHALELVDGPVFGTRSADRASYVWVDVENWMATWELKIADVALALSDAATESGDFDEAIWAAETGLRTLPTHVELTEALMTTYATRGDGAAAERVYTSHVAALEGNDFDDVAESTQQLCARLRARETA